MPQKFRALAVVAVEMEAGKPFELLRVGWRDAIPKLGLSEVQEIDRVEVQVLSVPAEH